MKKAIVTLFATTLFACTPDTLGKEADNRALALEWDYVSESVIEHGFVPMFRGQPIPVELEDWTLHYASVEEISETCNGDAVGCTDMNDWFDSATVLLVEPPNGDHCADMWFGHWAYVAMHEMVHVHGLKDHDEDFYAVLDTAYVRYVADECPNLKWWDNSEKKVIP